MAFDPSAIPIGQQFNYAATISASEQYLYALVLKIITARNFEVIADLFCQATSISNALFALNDPNISAANYQKIILGLNNITTPFNSQVYPKLTL